jgi:Protein of unknown function (DUF3667)
VRRSGVYHEQNHISVASDWYATAALSQISHSISECANCGERLGGAFCHTCGQKATRTDIRLFDLFHEAFHEFAHVDGKTLRTLRLLVTGPGKLTTEFLAGRRTRYIKPLRLYLTCSIVFFALTALVPDTSLRVIRMTYRASPGEAPLDPATQRQWEETSSARASRAIVHDLPRAMFVLMPFFAVLTWVLYRRARPFYVAHLYYSIHFHAFRVSRVDTHDSTHRCGRASRRPALTVGDLRVSLSEPSSRVWRHVATDRLEGNAPVVRVPARYCRDDAGSGDMERQE